MMRFLLANIGDSKSLIIHLKSTTHQQLNKAAKETGNLRLGASFVGLEDVEDLKADLNKLLIKMIEQLLICR